MLDRHPFFKSLIKLSAFITTSFVVVAICFIAFIAALFMFFSSNIPQTNRPLGSLVTISGDSTSRNNLLSIRIDGVILGDEQTTNFDNAITSGYGVKDQLYAAVSDESIKGVILEINSPGGTIYGAQAIADGVQYYRDQTKKPVIAYIKGFGASGAYWGAVATDAVYADYGSTIGSIGVISGPFKYYDTVLSESDGSTGEGVVTQKGIQSINITAGRSKDIGNPYRQLTQEEITVLQNGVNNEYTNFVDFVAARRSIAADTIRTTIGALIYDNKTAEELKLIDGTRNREAAYNELASRAGVDTFQVEQEQTASSWLQGILGATGATEKQHVSTRLCTDGSPLAYHGSLVDMCQ